MHIDGSYTLRADEYARWIAGKISEILGSEDDVVIEMCFNLLEGVRYVSEFLARTYLYSILTRKSAQHKGTSDTTHRISGKRYSPILQGVVEAMSQCAEQCARRAARVAGSEEA